MHDLLRQIAAALPPDVPQRLGVAVSGGSDSTALLLLLQQLSLTHGFALFAVTVDHDLRSGSAEEAAAVAQRAAQLDIPHETLVWREWDRAGNLQNEARKARYSMMSEWAVARNIPAVALGHTLDDQAETVVMRLARGAGVDGLSAMPLQMDRDGMRWLRPLLGIRRETLREFLRQQAVTWLDDPSNEDTRYDRVKVRQSLALLAPLGVTAEALAQVAQNMQAARIALEKQTQAASRRVATVTAGSVKLNAAEFDALPAEIARRLVVSAVQWIAGTGYAPRARSVASGLSALHADGSATLEGCRLLRKGGSIWIFREYNAVKSKRCTPDESWDGRWVLSAAAPHDGLTLAALGPEGLSACPEWRSMGLPRPLLLACPGVWAGDTLVAAPHAGKASEWAARLQKGDASFFDTAFSH